MVGEKRAEFNGSDEYVTIPRATGIKIPSMQMYLDRNHHFSPAMLNTNRLDSCSSSLPSLSYHYTLSTPTGALC
jgi:hypothetical protein